MADSNSETHLTTHHLDGPPPVSSFWRGGPPPSLPCRLGRYELIRQLGAGGMGAVYLAYDHQLDRKVALKVPHFGGPRPDVLRERFFRETRVAATISHPNICPIHDVGTLDDTPYLTMAYVEGEPLSARIRSNQPFPEREAAELIRVVASAMQEAHRSGIIHRDLKPANILMNLQGQPIVTDFGLASVADTGDERLTDSGVTVGTPAYMSPEQVNGDQALMSVGCDVYALGVILYEMLTCRLPFEGKRGELMASILRDPPVAPTQYRPNLSPGLEAICLTALAKHPADRFRTMKMFADALSDFLAGRAVPQAPPFRPLGIPGRTGSTKVPWFRRPLVWLAGAAAVLFAVLLIVLFDPGKGTVRFELSQPDADVVIKVDGRPISHRGSDELVTLRAGEHTVEVTGPWHEPFVQRIRLEANASKVVQVPLKSRPGPNGTGPAPVTPIDPKAPPPATDLKSALAQFAYFEGLGRYEQALEAAEKAVGYAENSVEPQNSVDAHIARGRAWLKLGQADKALRDADAALEMIQGDLPARALRAECLFAKRDYGTCVKECTEIIQKEKGISLRLDDFLDIRSRAYAESRLPEKAIADCTQALKIVPGLRKPVYLKRRADLYEATGQKEKAEADREAARQIEQNAVPLSKTPGRTEK